MCVCVSGEGASPGPECLTGNGPRAPSHASASVESLSKRHTSHCEPEVMPPCEDSAWKYPRYLATTGRTCEGAQRYRDVHMQCMEYHVTGGVGQGAGWSMHACMCVCVLRRMQWHEAGLGGWEKVAPQHAGGHAPSP